MGKRRTLSSIDRTQFKLIIQELKELSNDADPVDHLQSKKWSEHRMWLLVYLLKNDPPAGCEEWIRAEMTEQDGKTRVVYTAWSGRQR